MSAEAETVLGPVTVRSHGWQPRPRTFHFEAPFPGAACLVLTARFPGHHRRHHGGGHHGHHGARGWLLAWVSLDGTLLGEPLRFDEDRKQHALPLSMAAGPHELRVWVLAWRGGSLRLELLLDPRDEIAPSLVLKPVDGAGLETDQPLLEVSYSDAGSGVDPTSLVVQLDGQAVTGRFDVGTDQATWRVGVADYLWEGEHELRASVSDRSGNLGEAAATFSVSTPTGELLLGLESREPLERQRAAAKLVSREAELSVDALRRAAKQLTETPEPRAVDGLLGLARPDKGDLAVRLLSVAALGETARRDARTAGRAEVVTGLGDLMHEDLAPGVKALSARALGLTLNPAAIVPLDELHDGGLRVPAELPEGWLYEPRRYDRTAYELLTIFPAVKATIRIAGHGHLVGNPGELLAIWRKARHRAWELLGGGPAGPTPSVGGAP